MNLKKQKQEMLDLLLARGIKKRNIFEIMEKVPRENFIPLKQREKSYNDTTLPLESNQTISQPYTVAYMLQELEIKEGQKILEIGTGSGYNSALLSHLVGSNGKVITMEIKENLSTKAKDLLNDMGYTNITTIIGDGSKGCKSESPFDRIVVTAASPIIEKSWLSQLKDKGILLVPIGTDKQRLMKVTKNERDLDDYQDLGLFSFVPPVKK